MLTKESRGWIVKPVRWIGSHYYIPSSTDGRAWDRIQPIMMGDSWQPCTKGIEAWAIMVHDIDEPLAVFHRKKTEILEANRRATFATTKANLDYEDRDKISESFARKLGELLQT